MKFNDPHSQREAEKYENPIPSREVILQLLADNGQPLDFVAITEALRLYNERDTDALKKRLRAMERDGQLLYNRRRQYVPIERTDLYMKQYVMPFKLASYTAPYTYQKQVRLTYLKPYSHLLCKPCCIYVSAHCKRNRFPNHFLSLWQLNRPRARLIQ